MQFSAQFSPNDYVVTFQLAAQKPFATGAYTETSSPTDASVEVTVGSTGCVSQPGSTFHIFDVSYDGSGNLAAFAAQFDAHCLGNTEDGFVSYQSSVTMPTWVVSSDSTLDFGQLTLGDQSQFDVVTLANLGMATSITDVSEVGSGWNDFDGSTTCETGSLGMGQTCTMTLGFLPGALGQRSATIEPVDASATIPSVSVSGIGTAGYYTVDSRGYVSNFGDAGFYGDGQTSFLQGAVVGIANTPHNYGYWLVSNRGDVQPFGNATSFGSERGPLNAPILGMAASPDDQGYWLIAGDGGIFTFGDARFFGSTGSIRLNKPVVGMAPTPDGFGYWLVAADGGIFTFGDASFYGSTGSIRLNKPIVGMAPTPDGRGYWLVASDGGIFTFGDARYYGSTGNVSLAKPMVGMAPTWDGLGYWLVASDGGIFTFGDAPFYGSAVGPGEYGVISVTGSTSPTYQAVTDTPP